LHISDTSAQWIPSQGVGRFGIRVHGSDAPAWSSDTTCSLIDTTGDIGIELVKGVEECVIGVVGLTNGVGQGAFGQKRRAVGWRMVGGERLLDGRLDEAVVDELGKWIDHRREMLWLL